MRKMPSTRSKCYIYGATLDKDGKYYATVTHPMTRETLCSEEGFDTAEEALEISKTILDKAMDEEVDSSD